MGLYGAPDERRDLQAGQIRYAVDCDTGSFVQVDVLRPVVTHDVEQRDQPPVSFVVHGIGEKYRILDNEAGLFPDFPEQRFPDGLTVLDSAPETCPAARVSDSGLVVTVMHEQPVVCHDQQHRRPALRPGFRLSYVGHGGLRHPRLVRLVEGPVDVGGRPALVLESAGDQTLGEVLRERERLSLDLLERWGTDLLEALVALDRAGVDHRDIKPASLGIKEMREKREDRAKHLVLFDFSLSSAAGTAVTAGTPPYLDPFLDSPRRGRFDSAAERYSAAVVLFEMATGSVPAVAPARRSAPAAAKASRQHDEAGRPYRSFRGLLDHLGTLTRNELRFTAAPAAVPVLAEPTSEQRQAFQLIGAAIPLTLRK
jgi:hypothetical protein